MDAMGHVNNAAYFTYCESARMSYFAAVGLERYREDGRYGPGLVAATLNFRRQVHHPADLEVAARVAEIGRSSFRHDYVIFRRGGDEVVADGHGVIAWVDYAAGRAVALPEGLREAIRRYEDGE
jgi:acyl-CoA thioester hydrolase